MKAIITGKTSWVARLPKETNGGYDVEVPAAIVSALNIKDGEEIELNFGKFKGNLKDLKKKAAKLAKN